MHTEHVLTEQEAERSGIFSNADGRAGSVEVQDFVEWCACNCTHKGFTLQLVSDHSHEGAEFVRGFCGIGAMLRWAPPGGFVPDTGEEDTGAIDALLEHTPLTEPGDPIEERDCGDTADGDDGCSDADFM